VGHATPLPTVKLEMHQRRAVDVELPVCFSYTYEGSQMIWQEFTPGDPPPPVGSIDSGAHEVNLSAFGETAATYQFDTLPPGLFNSVG
jgi:hypothetical protein